MLIRDISMLDENMEIREHVDILIEKGRFGRIARTAAKKDPSLTLSTGGSDEGRPGKITGGGYREESGGFGDQEVIDGRDKLIMPGFYNTHCHLPMTLMRGLGEGLPLDRWLNEKMFPFESRLTGEDCYYGTLLSIMELLSSGCVSVSDMYFFISDIAKAVEESGIKADLSHGLSCGDPSVNPTELTGWKDTLELYRTLKNRPDDRIRVDVGIHSEYTTNERLVREAAGLASELGLKIHIHISETKKEHEECKARHGGLTPTEYMKGLGVFDSPVLAAHCVWLEDGDIEIFKESGANISHCVSSNLKLGSGVAPAAYYIGKGLNVCVATDGASSNNSLNMLKEMHLASLSAKGFNRDPEALPPSETLRMATRNGALAQGRNDCGIIREGMKADFLIVDLTGPHMTPAHSIASNLVYSVTDSDVLMTAVDGRIVYKDGEFPYIDSERVKYEVKKRSARICSELGWR